MSTVRVTQQMLVSRLLGNLNSQAQRILGLQEQIATGRRVNRPSDDPLAARRAVGARGDIAQFNQYLTNISTTRPQLVETETTVLNAVDIVQRGYELALRGANDTNGQLQLDAIAVEVNSLLEGLLLEGNHITNDRYIFGGTRTLSRAFEETRLPGGEIRAVTYAGNDEHYSVDINRIWQVVVNETGDDLFMPAAAGTVDLFQSLIDLRTDLRNGDTAAIQDRIDELDRGQGQLLLSAARMGARQLRIEGVEEDLLAFIVQSQQVQSDSADADYAEVILNLNAQENAFQATLSAGARVIQPSLLDFLR